jgi:hypothetical protein
MHLPAYGVIYSWAMYLFSNIVQLRTCSYNGENATAGIFLIKKVTWVSKQVLQCYGEKHILLDSDFEPKVYAFHLYIL